MIDTSTEFGQRVERRLRQEPIIWLTTVDRSGRPQPRPVWFLWDGETVLIFSRTEGAKIRHIQHNPHVALNFDSDGVGGDIVVITGEATIVQEPMTAVQIAEYVEKYAAGMKRIGLSPDQFADQYDVAIRVRPHGLRGH